MQAYNLNALDHREQNFTQPNKTIGKTLNISNMIIQLGCSWFTKAEMDYELWDTNG